jgi:hypothetical protein
MKNKPNVERESVTEETNRIMTNFLARRVATFRRVTSSTQFFFFFSDSLSFSRAVWALPEVSFFSLASSSFTRLSTTSTAAWALSDSGKIQKLCNSNVDNSKLDE